ncbi:hypothetical protein N7461_001084 [Penicillium sp. DV-2018c]|nr:hypothetical protein N7461_001084 [Penicillium sp. DV-2018c]
MSPVVAGSTSQGATLQVPQSFVNEVDLETWRSITKYDDLTSPTEEQTTSHIVWIACRWEGKRLVGRDLWTAFTHQFDDWDEERWGDTTKQVQKHLHQFLMDNGVYVETKAGLCVATALYNVAAADEYQFWNSAQIQEWSERSTVFKRKLEDPAFVDNIIEPDEPLNLPRRIRNASPHVQAQPQAPARPALRQPYLVPTYIPQPREHSAPPPPQTSTTAPRVGSPDPTWRASDAPNRENNYAEPLQGLTPKQLKNLARMYTDDEMRYSGKMYDVLEFKLIIFRDCALRIGIPQPHFAAALPIMLTGPALSYYYAHLCEVGIPRDFHTLVSRIRCHFETEDRHQLYASAWRNTTFYSVISENPGKSRIECLEILLDKITKIQRALPTVDKSQETLLSQLWSAISVNTESRPASQRLTTPKGLDEQYGTDRKYRGNGRNNRLGRGNRDGRAGDRPASDRRCYVCGKPGCWSTRHTSEERRKAYDRYKNDPGATDKTKVGYVAFLAWWEGVEGLESDDDEDTPVSQYHRAIDSQAINSGRRLL